jgi:hypothetical protein
MKTKPKIESILILTGNKDAETATAFFKTHFFAKNDSLDAMLALKDLTQTWVKEKADLDELDFIVEKRVQAYQDKDFNLSARLREDEWTLIEKYTKMPAEDFKLHDNRSSKIFGKTRVYIAFKGRVIPAAS